MNKNLTALFLALLFVVPAFGQARQRPARIEIAQEITIPARTSCDRLTNQQDGSLCFDTNADIDGDGTLQGALYVYNNGAWGAVPSFDAISFGEVTFCDGPELSPTDGQFLVYDAGSACFDLTDIAPKASELTQSSSPCSGGQYAIGWAANGTLTCAPITDAAVPNDITVQAIDADADGRDEVYIIDSLIDEVALNPSDDATFPDYKFSSNGVMSIEGPTQDGTVAEFIYPDWASNKTFYWHDGSGVVLVDQGGSPSSPQYNWPNADGSAGQVLSTDGAAGLSWISVTGSPGGSDTQVQLNDGGSFGADADFTYDASADRLSVKSIKLEQGYLVDADGDGSPESVYNVGDWDGDGTYEMADIRAAIAALTDSDDQLYIHIGPHTFTETDCPVDVLVEVPENATLVGSGWSTHLQHNGYGNGTSCTILGPESVRTGAVVSNVHIRNLQVDGGATETSGDHTNSSRIGVNITRCNGCTTDNLYIHHTIHTCLYTSRGDDIRHTGHRLDHCGGYSDTAGSRYPCMYVFADNGVDLTNVHHEDIYCTRSAQPAINYRIGPGSGTRLENLTWTDIRVNTGENAEGVRAECAVIADTTRSTFRNIRCEESGAFELATSGQYQSGTSAGMRGIDVDGLVIVDGDGIEIQAYSDQVEFRNVVVDGTRDVQDCVEITTPVRGVTIDGLIARNCERYGLNVVGATGAAPDEALRLRNIEINGVDAADPTDGTAYMGVRFSGAAHGLVAENITVRGTTGYGFRASAGLTNARLTNITLDGTAPYYDGTTTVASLGTCAASNFGRWKMVTDGASSTDCTTGSGSTKVKCQCQSGGSWAAYSGLGARAGIFIAPGDQSGTVITGVLAKNWEGSWGMSVSGGEFVLDNIVAVTEDDFTTTDQIGAVTITTDNGGVPRVNATCENVSQRCVSRPTNQTEPTQLVGTSLPATCNQGDIFHDTDGDGSTRCGGAECFLAVCGAANNWEYALTGDDITLPDASGTVPLYVTAGTSGNCVEWGAGGMLVDAGAACGGGGGGEATAIDADGDGTNEIYISASNVYFDPNDNGVSDARLNAGVLYISENSTDDNPTINMYNEANGNISTSIISSADGDFALWHRDHDADSYGSEATSLLGWQDSGNKLFLGSADGHAFQLFPFNAKLTYTNETPAFTDQAYQANLNIGGSSLFHAGSTVSNVNGFDSDYPITVASWGQDGEMINFLFPDAGTSSDPGNTNVRAHITVSNQWDTFNFDAPARITLGSEGNLSGWLGFHGSDFNNPLFRLEQDDDLAAFDLNDDATDDLTFQYNTTTTYFDITTGYNRLKLITGGNDTSAIFAVENSLGTRMLQFGDAGSFANMYIPAITASGTGNRYVCADSTASNQISLSSSACTTSSVHFKENVLDLSYGIEEFMALRPVEFDWKAGWTNEEDPTDIGFIAEDVAAVLPEAAVHENGKVKNFEDRAILALLVKTVQEQQRTIEALEARITALETSRIETTNSQRKVD